MELVNNLAKSFLLHPEKYAPWLIESCKAYDSSRVLFLLIVLQSTIIRKDSGISFFILLFLSSIFPFLFFFVQLQILLMFAFLAFLFSFLQFGLSMILYQFMFFYSYFDFFKKIPTVGSSQFIGFFEVLYPVLKIEWDVYESTYGASIDKVLQFSSI